MTTDTSVLYPMTPKAVSLLLYLETCAVDKAGAVSQQRMNREDFDLAEAWDEIGFIKFGRINSRHLTVDRTHWVELSDLAWAVAAVERKARAIRMLENRKWKKTSEDA